VKDTRGSVALLIFIILAHIAYFLPQDQSKSDFEVSYPVTVCPGQLPDSRATALLPTSSVKTRLVSGVNQNFKRSSSGKVSLDSGAILVSGNPGNSIVIQSRSSRWTSAATCSQGIGTEWFVGGTANVTSRGRLSFINSGLAPAIVDVTAFSENGASPTLSYSIDPASEKIVRMDSIDPGANSLVIKVVTKSGRVTTFVSDERGRGLNNLGGDYISPQYKPARELIIPSITNQIDTAYRIKHRLRVMTTSRIDSRLTVEVISANGAYVPVGLDNIKLSAREVRDIELPRLDVGSNNFALKLNSDKPILAAVQSGIIGERFIDFAWIVPGRDFKESTLNFHGLEPRLNFVGERIRITARWSTRQGKTREMELNGSDFLTWLIPPNSRELTLRSSRPIVAGALWRTSDGITYLPLLPSAELESAIRPVADISVIQPRG
jgi:hypothetical protein